MLRHSPIAARFLRAAFVSGALLARGEEPATEPALRFRIVWELPAERTTFQVRFEDGRGEHWSTRVEEYAPVEGPRRSFDSRALASAVEALYPALRTLPELAHTPSSFAGVQVSLRVEKAGRKAHVDLRHAFNYHHPDLERLYQALRAALGDESGLDFESLAGLTRYEDHESFEYKFPCTPEETLLEPLDPPSPDVELRRIALQAIGDHEVYDFVPKLEELYARSQVAGADPDYFLARALLRLGSLEGAERVLAVAQSAHPSWALEAAETLESALGEAYGERIVPAYDFMSESDPRPEAAETFLAWLRAHESRLQQDRARKAFRLDEEEE